MKTLLFISRHAPTVEQYALAEAAGYALCPVGEVDAFDRDAVNALLSAHKDADVCCVHPAIAVIARDRGRVLAFYENALRPAEGDKPAFYAKALHIYD